MTGILEAMLIIRMAILPTALRRNSTDFDWAWAWVHLTSLQKLHRLTVNLRLSHQANWLLLRKRAEIFLRGPEWTLHLAVGLRPASPTCNLPRSMASILM